MSGIIGKNASRSSGVIGTLDAGIASLAADSSPQLGGFLDAAGNYIQMEKGGDISSASPLVIDTDGDYFVVTGTTNFAAMTVAADRHFFLEFAAILTITHGGGTIDIPGAANYTSVASDVIECVSTAANVVTIVGMELVSGKAQVESVTLANSVTLTNKTLGAVTLSGAITGADQTVSAINLKDYGEITVAKGDTSGADIECDLNDGNCFSAIISTDAVTFTFVDPTASDELCSFIVFLTNGGSQTVNWPGTVDWEGGSAPSLTSSGLDVIAFSTIDGGTIWHGFVISTDSK
jgi:hypothetical protein